MAHPALLDVFSFNSVMNALSKAPGCTSEMTLVLSYLREAVPALVERANPSAFVSSEMKHCNYISEKYFADQTTLSELRKELETLKTANDGMHERLAIQDRDYARLRRNVDNAKILMDVMQHKCAEHRKAYQAVSSALRNSQTRHTLESKAYQAEIDRLKTVCEGQVSMLRRADHEVARLKRIANNLFDTKNAELDKYQRTCETLQAQVNDLTEKLRKVETAYAHQQTQPKDTCVASSGVPLTECAIIPTDPLKPALRWHTMKWFVIPRELVSSVALGECKVVIARPLALRGVMLGDVLHAVGKLGETTPQGTWAAEVFEQLAKRYGLCESVVSDNPIVRALREKYWLVADNTVPRPSIKECINALAFIEKQLDQFDEQFSNLRRIHKALAGMVEVEAQYA